MKKINAMVITAILWATVFCSIQGLAAVVVDLSESLKDTRG